MPDSLPVLPELDEEELKFLLDEGLEMLAEFRHIRDRHKRDLIVALIRAITADQGTSNGST